MNSKLVAVAAVAAGITVAGCAGMSDTQQRTLSGAAIGTAVGAGVGAITGDWAWAAGGAAVGAATGFLVDQQRQREDEAYRRGVETGKTQPR
jgi:hypothetical protein